MNTNEKLKVRNSMFLYNIFYTIAGAMVSSFSLIYIYNLTSSIAYATLYMTLLLIVSLVFVTILKKFYVKNPCAFLIISIVISLCSQIFMLTSVFSHYVTIIIVGILSGIASACHYTPYNIILASSSDENVGKSLNKEKTAIFIANMFSPILAGGLFTLNKYISLIIATALYAICIIPLIVRSKDVKSLINISTLEKTNNENKNKDLIIGNYNDKDKNKDLVTGNSNMLWFRTYYISMGLKDLLGGIIWPLYLAVNNISYMSFGILSSLSTIGVFITNITSNYISDKKKWKSLSIIALALTAICFIARFYLVHTIALYIFTFLIFLLEAYYNNPMFNEYIKYSKATNNYSKNMSTREYLINGSKIIPSFIFIALPFFTPYMYACSIVYCIMIYPIIKIKQLNGSHDEQTKQ